MSDTTETMKTPPQATETEDMRRNKVLETEANVFAVCLLIPKEFIKRDLANGLDLTDDTQFKKLCNKYQVTPAMMTLRLSLLKLKS